MAPAAFRSRDWNAAVIAASAASAAGSAQIAFSLEVAAFLQSKAAPGAVRETRIVSASGARLI